MTLRQANDRKIYRTGTAPENVKPTAAGMSRLTRRKEVIWALQGSGVEERTPLRARGLSTPALLESWQ